VQFDVTSAGRYTLELSPSASSAVIVAPTLSGALHSMGLPVGLGGAGAVLAVTGLVLLVVGISRRSRARAAQPRAAAGPSPSWYPDPYVPGGQRWWDGYRWH